MWPVNLRAVSEKNGVNAHLDVRASNLVTVDVLTTLLDSVRSSGALFGRSIVVAPWSVRFEARAQLTLVSMLRGEGWIVPDGADPARLGETDVAIAIGPEPFTVADSPDAAAAPTYVMHDSGTCTAADGTGFSDGLRLGVRTRGESLDGPNILLTGTYQVRGRVVCERLVSALPRVLVVPNAGQLCPVLDLTVAEVERDDPGQQAVLDRLLDLLLLTTLREWFARPDVEPPAWYRALGDPVVGRALRLVHDQPARPWTVALLAAEAGVSRATFARRFTELLGQPPMTYLTALRLSLAADLLARTDATVEAVARQVGYGSAFALSVALKRVHGSRPTELRAAG
jgi:AraC-like DNA-binding protein